MYQPHKIHTLVRKYRCHDGGSSFSQQSLRLTEARQPDIVHLGDR